MVEIIINYGTLISYFLFSFDILLQIQKIYERKSSKDISINGLLVRIVAGILIISKFFLIGDLYLILGQAVFMAFLSCYIFLVIFYRIQDLK